MFCTLFYKTILCPTSTAVTKIVNKFIRIMFLARDNLEEGVDIEEMSYPTMPVYNDYDYTDYDNFSDIDEWDHNDSSVTDSDIDIT